MIEGFNLLIDKLRLKKGIKDKSYLVLHSFTGKTEFGGFSNIDWKVYYTKNLNVPLFTVSTRARSKDNYQRELSEQLMQSLLKVSMDHFIIEKIINGESIQ